MCYRGLSLEDCWRVGGPLGFPILLTWRLLRTRGQWRYLPIAAADYPCAEDDLTPRCREHLAPTLAEAPRLGCSLVSYSRDPRLKDPSFADGGGFWALHEDRRRILGGFYCRTETETASRPVAVEHVVRYCLFLTPELRSTSVTDSRQGICDPGWARVIRLPGAGPDALDRRLQEELLSHTKAVLQVTGPEEAVGLLSQREARVYERYVARGLYVRVSPEEERRILEESGVGSETPRVDKLGSLRP